MYYYGARYYDPRISIWTSTDPLSGYNPIIEDEHYIDGDHNLGVLNAFNLATYSYCYQSPLVLIDPNGKQNVAAAAGGAIIGGLIGGGIEAFGQYMKYGEVKDWGAVGGASLRGAVTGGVAGFTNGASLLTTVGAGAAANVVGGVADRAIQGKRTTVKDVLIDASIGGLTAGVGNKLNGYLSSTLKNVNRNAGKSIVAIGEWGEARLAQVLKNAGLKPSEAFSTNLGKRYVDRLVNGVAHEAKGGFNVQLTSSIKKQILKDAELIKEKQIKGAVWHFFNGVDKKVLDYLSKNGIKYKVH